MNQSVEQAIKGCYTKDDLEKLVTMWSARIQSIADILKLHEDENTEVEMLTGPQQELLGYMLQEISMEMETALCR